MYMSDLSELKKINLENVISNVIRFTSLVTLLKYISEIFFDSFDFENVWFVFYSELSEDDSFYYTFKKNGTKNFIPIKNIYNLKKDEFFDYLKDSKEEPLILKKLSITNKIGKSKILNSISEDFIISFKSIFKNKLHGFVLFSTNKDEFETPEIENLKNIIGFLNIYINNLILSEQLDLQKNLIVSKSNSELSILNNITKNNLDKLNLSTLYESITSYLISKMNFDRVMILTQSENIFSNFNGIVATNQNIQSIFVKNLFFDNLSPSINELTELLKIKNLDIDKETFVAIPIIKKSEIVGILGIDNFSQKTQIAKNDLVSLNSIANEIGLFIENIENDKKDKFDFGILFKTVSSFNTIFDYELATTVILEKISNLFSISHGYIISLEIDSYCQVVAFLNKKSIYANKKIELTKPLVTAIVSKDVIFYNNLETPKDKCLDLKHSIIVPLYTKDKVIGLLCLGEIDENKNLQFTKNELDLIQSISKSASITLENAQLYNKLEDIVIERTVDLVESNKILQIQKQKLEILSMKLQAIINSVPDGIIVIDQDNNILNSNPSSEKILNSINPEKSPGVIAEKSLISVLEGIRDNKNCKILDILINSLLDKKNISKPIDMDFVLDIHNRFYYKVIIAPVVSNSEIIDIDNNFSKENYVIVFRNITKEIELDKLKSDFVAVVSHELKTPLSAIMGFSTIIEDGMAGEVTEEQKDYLSKIQHQGERLIRLINDLLDFSKLEANQMPLYLQLLSVEDLVIEVIEVLRPLVEDKNLRINMQMDEDLPLIEVDPDKIKQVLINLIGNAIKFTEKNVGVIDVFVNYIEQDKELLFKVSDNGIGMPEDALKKLFTKFYQVDPSSTRKYGGTGLGLPIAKKIVELMDGEIWVDSKLGKGSTFYFTIPIAKEDAL